MQESKKGLVLVYTGNGKGKTTASLGLALRAVGHGARVFMVQFKKSDPYTGELQAIRKYLPRFDVFQAGKNKMVEGRLKEDGPDVIREGFKVAGDALQSGKYDLIILDEINIVVSRGLLPVEEVRQMLAERPDGVDMVLTGRNAPPEIIELADMVSEVKEIKHHYQKGVRARPGIEY